MKFVLVNGKKRSGKDFFAKLLKDELSTLGHKSSVMSFADPIKDIISITLGISPELLDQFKNDQAPIYINGVQISNSRLILQNFGTEAMKKHFGENVWVDLLKAKAEQIDDKFIIVPDFRFISENFEDSITVRIVNKDVHDANDGHRSENELNEFVCDYTLDNTGYRLTVQDVNDFAKKLGEVL